MPAHIPIGDLAPPVAQLGRRGALRDAGPPVALIHGLLGSNAMWKAEGLVALFAPHEAVALPLPGHHPWSLPPGTVADLLRGDRLVDAYAGTLRRTFDGRPVRLVGHSTGALVALEIARRHPELVAGVCVVGALQSGRLLGSRSLARELACLPVAGAWAFRAALRLWLRNARTFRAGLRSVMGAGLPGGEMPIEVMHDLRRSDPLSLHAMALWLREWAGLAEPDRVDAPVFSVICAGDPVVHPAQQLALARALRRVRTVVLSSGHLPMVEQPAAFCDALGRWLGTPAVRIAAVPRRQPPAPRWEPRPPPPR
jgi:pimeloyl-ACP methyl ester carboxylesterase